MIRFEGNKDYFELDLVSQKDEDLPSKGDAYISIKLSSAGFSGENSLWVMSESICAFCRALMELEKTRRGSAVLESISPGELTLIIRNIDRAGHMGIEGKTGYHVQRENSSAFHSVEFGFEFDPSQLQKATSKSWVQKNAEQKSGADR
jgi:hypothetical protein